MYLSVKPKAFLLKKTHPDYNRKDDEIDSLEESCEKYVKIRLHRILANLTQCAQQIVKVVKRRIE